MKNVKGAPTELNLWVLKKYMAGVCRCPNSVEAVSAPHIRRCMKAGLVVVEGSDLVLTPAGEIALVGVS